MRDYLVVLMPRGCQGQARQVITSMSLRLGQWGAGELVLRNRRRWSRHRAVHLGRADDLDIGFLAWPETGVCSR
jgi:hypothetical protein